MPRLPTQEIPRAVQPKGDAKPCCLFCGGKIAFFSQMENFPVMCALLGNTLDKQNL